MSDKPVEAEADCTLPHSAQTRNMLLYAFIWAMIYSASPVAYVGLLQANLLKDQHFSDTSANLPAGAALWFGPLSILVVCRFTQVRLLKPLLVFFFLLTGAMGGIVAAVLLFLTPEMVLVALIAYGGVWGCAKGVLISCLWEVVGRGISAKRRGQAFALAFGAGPLCGVAASLAVQGIRSGSILGYPDPPLETLKYPYNYALVHAATVPIMILAAFLASRFVVVLPEVEKPPAALFDSILSGFADFFSYRLILIACIAYVLVFSGHEVLQNISLYMKQVVGGEPSEGNQLALRFGFKFVAGFALGWLLIKTNARTLLLITALLLLAAVVWAALAPADWLLIAFGILGAGELFGVYYPNYVLGCSPPAKMRRNMAFALLITLPVGFAPVLYGAISDIFGKEDKAFGYQMSFLAAMLVLVTTFILVLTLLPSQPRPPAEGERGA
jgi:MFS family permease